MNIKVPKEAKVFVTDIKSPEVKVIAAGDVLQTLLESFKTVDTTDPKAIAEWGSRPLIFVVQGE